MGAGRQAAPPRPFQTALTPPGLETPVPGKQAGQIEENSSVAVKSASPNCSASLSIPGWTETPNKVSLQSLYHVPVTRTDDKPSRPLAAWSHRVPLVATGSSQRDLVLGA